jgi:hypothetical protein
MKIWIDSTKIHRMNSWYITLWCMCDSHPRFNTQPVKKVTRRACHLCNPCAFCFPEVSCVCVDSVVHLLLPRLRTHDSLPEHIGGDWLPCSCRLKPHSAPSGALWPCLVTLLVLLPASFHSSAPLHPARLRLLNFTFPREPGWLHTRMVQGLVCQPLKTLMHACNQTRSRLVLDQQQRQPNTAMCIVSSWLKRAWIATPTRLAKPWATDHPHSADGWRTPQLGAEDDQSRQHHSPERSIASSPGHCQHWTQRSASEFSVLTKTTKRHST